MKNTIEIENGKILIVDDEQANAMALQMLLEDGGFNDVTATTRPEEAVEICFGESVDLLILDLNMPRMDGFQVMEKLDALDKDERPLILMLTAQNQQDIRRRALESGARDYVTKPFDFAELRSRVTNLLEMKLLQNYMRGQNLILEELVRKRTSQLMDSQERLLRSRLQVVQRLGRAAEYRDNETGYHILRMSKMSAALAKAVGLSAKECQLILNASPMHDIGKIGIPDSILLKPGKLEPDEWKRMQCHSQIGADILMADDSKLLSMASRIALTHHEKWDGSGYPGGLSGDSIPIEGRICAVADVFDALTSERPYKKAWPVDKAVALIKQESGKHFDPTLVKLFEKNLEEMLHIKESHVEPEGEQMYSDVPTFALGREIG